MQKDIRYVRQKALIGKENDQGFADFDGKLEEIYQKKQR
jgi:hypothetical protein